MLALSDADTERVALHPLNLPTGPRADVPEVSRHAPRDALPVREMGLWAARDASVLVPVLSPVRLRARNAGPCGRVPDRSDTVVAKVYFRTLSANIIGIVRLFALVDALPARCEERPLGPVGGQTPAAGQAPLFVRFRLAPPDLACVRARRPVFHEVLALVADDPAHADFIVLRRLCPGAGGTQHAVAVLPHPHVVTLAWRKTRGPRVWVPTDTGPAFAWLVAPGALEDTSVVWGHKPIR